MSVCGVDQMEDHEMECAGMIPNMFHCSGLWGVTPTDDTASDMVSGMRNEIRFMDVDVFRLCARCLWNYVPCRPCRFCIDS